MSPSWREICRDLFSKQLYGFTFVGTVENSVGAMKKTSARLATGRLIK